ncbi:MAG: hypothetical protein ACRER5_21990, partial [Pseudomonas sp.]
MVDPQTNIGPAPAAVTRQVSDERKLNKEVATATYRFVLPPDWEAVSIPGMPADAQSWQNTADAKGVRSVSVYVDTAIQDKAVNKILPVQRNGAGLVLAGDVSDNCTNFITPENLAAGKATGRARATWQGVSFWCDT